MARSVEHDLDDTGALVPVDRPRGQNKAGIIAAVVTTPTPLHPEGVTRVRALRRPDASRSARSPSRSALRVIAALDLAERMQVPVEWFALSAGARISMDSGTENMDWVAKALRRIVEFTQAGGEINVVVAGHQRRRPAVLERRGDDAHAHQGHPGDDARTARWC